MFSLFAQMSIFTRLARWMAPAGQSVSQTSQVAHDLLQRSQARAGLNPRQAQELRSAAQAYLSVVR